MHLFAHQLTLPNIYKYLCQLQTRPRDAQVMEGFTMRKRLDAQRKVKAAKTQLGTKRKKKGLDPLPEEVTARVRSGRRRGGVPATTRAT